MSNQFISLSRYPRAILHVDCDSFFASVEQSIHPDYRQKPVITGKERGIVAAASIEAKKFGIKRGIKLWDVQKIVPQTIIVPSDYETYSLYSKRLFAILRQYTPLVEEYSIDEAFAEITGLSRLHRKSYPKIAAEIKQTIESSLGITVSIGLSLSKTLAKIGSKWNKPSGITFIPGQEIHNFLKQLPVGEIWGIGPRTAAYCQTLNIQTAFDLTQKEEHFIKKHFTKPTFETWKELCGHAMLRINTEEKTDYASISKTRTFTPPSTNKDFVFSQLVKNLENAFIKVRRHNLLAHGLIAFLKTQEFKTAGLDTKLNRGTAFPQEVLPILKQIFDQIYKSNTPYRATGIVLTNLQADSGIQLSLFEPEAKVESYKQIYSSIDKLAQKYGKHIVHLATSNTANTRTQHLYARGDITARKLNRLPGENKRKHLAIPMLLYKEQRKSNKSKPQSHSSPHVATRAPYSSLFSSKFPPPN